jgi:hypothetical protein
MDWPAARDVLRAPIFASLRPAIERLPQDRWPSHEDLTRAASNVVTSRGKPLRFVLPQDEMGRERRYYELHIAETGEVETRPENWHDLFNALAWIAYPKAKATINAQHAAIFAERGEAEAKRRSPERDALTLFDEGGVAVVSSNPDFFDLIREFEWKQLFWDRREELAQHARFLAFGHALFEKALDPHLGMVAKTVFIQAKSLEISVDDHLAAHFSDRRRFASPKLMAPMPLLGVPGWHPGTSRESFYDDRDHFRPRAGR